MKRLPQLEPKKDGATSYFKFTWIRTLFNNNFPNVFGSKLYKILQNNIKEGPYIKYCGVVVSVLTLYSTSQVS
jgi:hypothetical protein